MKKEISKKSKVELEKELDKSKLTLRDVRFGIAGSKSKNVKEQKTLKKNIARIMTELRTMNQ